MLFIAGEEFPKFKIHVKHEAAYLGEESLFSHVRNICYILSFNLKYCNIQFVLFRVVCSVLSEHVLMLPLHGDLFSFDGFATKKVWTSFQVDYCRASYHRMVCYLNSFIEFGTC